MLGLGHAGQFQCSGCCGGIVGNVAEWPARSERAGLPLDGGREFVACRRRECHRGPGTGELVCWIAQHAGSTEGQQGEAVVIASTDGKHLAAGKISGERQRHRDGGVGRTVTPPDVSHTVGRQGQAMVGTSGNGHHGFAGQSAAVNHGDRHGTSSGRPGPEFAASIFAPGEHLAIGRERQAVIHSGGHGSDGFTSQGTAGVHCHRHQALGGAVVAELPDGVETPGINPPVGTHSQTEVIAGGNGRYRFASQHSTDVSGHRHRTVSLTVVANAGIASPADNAAF